MKYIVYSFLYGVLQLNHFLWNFKFMSYSLKEYTNDVENYEYPIN